MGVDHSRFDIIMSQQLLNGSDVVAVFQQMRGKAVAKGMYRSPLIYACFIYRVFESFLED
jgi:hypothetical protein